jgi:hypothetical protein
MVSVPSGRAPDRARSRQSVGVAESERWGDAVEDRRRAGGPSPYAPPPAFGERGESGEDVGALDLAQLTRRAQAKVTSCFMAEAGTASGLAP